MKIQISPLPKKKLLTLQTPASISSSATLTLPLSELDPNLLRTKNRVSDGEKYWEVMYDLVLEVSDGKVHFLIEIGGREYRRVEVAL